MVYIVNSGTVRVTQRNLVLNNKTKQKQTNKPTNQTTTKDLKAEGRLDRKRRGSAEQLGRRR